MSHAKFELTALLALLAAPCVSAGADSQSVPLVRVATEPRVIRIVEGDDIAFSRVENAEEFSQSRVAQIEQDDRGFMWFGTAYGLNRFDGYGYTLFAGNSRVPNQLSGVYVSAIAKDRSGRLWIASDQGLDTFDPETGMFRQMVYASAPAVSTSIQSIYEDRSGSIWLSTNAGLYGLDSNGRTRVHFTHDAANPASLGSNDVKSAQEGRDGTFWIMEARPCVADRSRICTNEACRCGKRAR